MNHAIEKLREKETLNLVRCRLENVNKAPMETLTYLIDSTEKSKKINDDHKSIDVLKILKRTFQNESRLRDATESDFFSLKLDEICDVKTPPPS